MIVSRGGRLRSATGQSASTSLFNQGLGCPARLPDLDGDRTSPLCLDLLKSLARGDDGAFKRYIPGPKTGGFARGSFIAWRRHERVRDAVLRDSISDLYDFLEVVGEGQWLVAMACSARWLRYGPPRPASTNWLLGLCECGVGCLR